MRWTLCIAVCAFWSCTLLASGGARAQQTSPATQSTEHVGGVQAQLSEAKVALERARFEEASQLLNEVLGAPQLSARLYNQALELLAIAQIAARREREAKETLGLLLRRDPEHPRQVQDPGPAVDAAFARARQAPAQPLQVTLRYVVERDAAQRVRLIVDMTEGRDAVESVHVFVSESDGALLSHLVGQVEDEEPLSFVLPETRTRGAALKLYVEAHAPSGAVLGRLGERGAELKVVAPYLAPPLQTCAPARRPLRREWWLWTTLGLVVSGFAVATAVTAN